MLEKMSEKNTFKLEIRGISYGTKAHVKGGGDMWRAVDFGGVEEALGFNLRSCDIWIRHKGKNQGIVHLHTMIKLMNNIIFVFLYCSSLRSLKHDLQNCKYKKNYYYSNNCNPN